MEQRQLGGSGFTVPALTYGTGTFGGGNEFFKAWGAADVKEATRLVDVCLEHQLNMFDSADVYSGGLAEEILGQAIKGRRERVQLSVKFGALRAPSGAWLGFDARPAAVKTFAAHSLKRLGVEVIDVYRPARLDPQVPIEDTIGAIQDLVKEGYVRQIGLSEVGASTIERAAKVHPIADLQIEYSLLARDIEGDILKTCRELGIGITAYGVLARGLISGHWTRDRSGGQDFRNVSPRFQGANLDANLGLAESLRKIADEIGASPAQIAIAWVAAQGRDIVPLVGARRRDRLNEALGALDVELTPAHLAALAEAFPPGVAAGARYPEAQLAHMDSEKR